MLAEALASVATGEDVVHAAVPADAGTAAVLPRAGLREPGGMLRLPRRAEQRVGSLLDMRVSFGCDVVVGIEWRRCFT